MFLSVLSVPVSIVILACTYPRYVLFIVHKTFDIVICYLLKNLDKNVVLFLTYLSLPLKVRSLTLDVKVWEPSVLTLFQSLGNAFANSIWEDLLQSRGSFQFDLGPTGYSPADALHFQLVHFLFSIPRLILHDFSTKLLQI